MAESPEDREHNMPPVKSMLHGKVIQGQSREIVANVFAFMKREAEFGQQIPLRCVTKRVIAATGVSERSIRRIQREAEIVYSGQAECFISPRLRKNKLKKTVKSDSSPGGEDNSQGAVIKREDNRDSVSNCKEGKSKKKGGKMYPSLEDLKVDQLARAQRPYEAAQALMHQQQRNASAPPPSQVSYPVMGAAPPLSSLYPSVTMDTTDNQPLYHHSLNNAAAPPPYNVAASKPHSAHPPQQSTRHYHTPLYPTLSDYMGLDLSPEMIAQNVPEYAHVPTTINSMEIQHVSSMVPTTSTGMIAPISGQSLGLQRAQVTHGIRELTVCKDANGKVGLRVQAVNNGVFVCVVVKGSPAALAGLRFGDQVLQVNGIIVAGFTMDQVHKLFRESPVNGISVVVRDRPFERTVTLHKDSLGHVGFHFKEGKIVGLVQDSSAARNGLLTDHHILEVNGQNVVGITDKEISAVIDEGGISITITIIPSFVFDHMVKKMSSSLLKNAMDHSIPNI